MKRFGILLILIAFLPGCLLDGSTEKPQLYESDLSVPENLLKNLVTAYLEREAGPYVNLLATDFNFRFASEWVAPDYPDGLNRENDVLFTGNMFGSRDVVELRLHMAWSKPKEALWKGERVITMNLTGLALDVDMVGDRILRVGGDPQDFYLRLGKEELEEDPLRYYIVGWVDHGPQLAPSGRELSGPTPVERTSWGGIKAEFQ